MTADRVFYLPGAEQASWNKVPPPAASTFLAANLLVHPPMSQHLQVNAGETSALMFGPSACVVSATWRLPWPVAPPLRILVRWGLEHTCFLDEASYEFVPIPTAPEVCSCDATP